MSKQITISDEAAALYQELMDMGAYPTLESAVEGIALSIQPPESDAALEAILECAAAELERGEGIPFTRELSLEILERAKQRHGSVT